MPSCDLRESTRLVMRPVSAAAIFHKDPDGWLDSEIYGRERRQEFLRNTITQFITKKAVLHHGDNNRVEDSG